MVGEVEKKMKVDGMKMRSKKTAGREKMIRLIKKL